MICVSGKLLWHKDIEMTKIALLKGTVSVIITSHPIPFLCLKSASESPHQ